MGVNITDYDVVFGRTITPAPNENKSPKKDAKGSDYTVHCLLGDCIKLSLADGQQVAASDHKFQLTNGLDLTYGQISSLAGDFYGTSDPISDGKDDNDKSTRFIQAYNTLAGVSSCQPQEARDILAVLQTEVDAVNNALGNHLDPSAAYSKLPYASVKLQSFTLNRSNNQPSYLGLAKINWDLFGRDAHVAYNTGHSMALEKAIAGDLDLAYTMNAFADRFLASFFTAGHLRTPRRFLHSSTDIAADACAKFMYDEDNAIGLSVKNPAGESWTVYGDKHALDKANEDNVKRCKTASKASADEVYDAYKSKKAALPSEYKAWIHAPTLWSARVPQTLSPLFTFDNERREVITDRKTDNTTGNYTFLETATKCKTSGWWNDPITMNHASPKPKILAWTSTAACSDKDFQAYVFYQCDDDYVYVSQIHSNTDGKIPGGIPIFKARHRTALAAVCWDEGKQSRVFYLDEHDVLQEYCFNGTSWFLGSLSQHVPEVQWYLSSIAAITWTENYTTYIRVYFQQALSRSMPIKELCWNGHWYSAPGSLELHDAIGSSIIAASVTVTSVGPHIRVYFHDDHQSLREHCFDPGRGWYRGTLNTGYQPGRPSVNVITAGWPRLQIYWREGLNTIVRRESNQGYWGPIETFLTNVEPVAEFSVIQWKNRYIRVYHPQANSHLIREYCCDDGRHYDGVTLQNS